jgi:hypothetical protein
MELRGLVDRIGSQLKKCGPKMDAYSKAHLVESKERIERALEAGYTYNSPAAAAPTMMLLFGKEQQDADH